MNSSETRRPETGAIDRFHRGLMRRLFRQSLEENWYLLAIFLVVIPGSVLLFWILLRMM